MTAAACWLLAAAGVAQPLLEPPPPPGSRPQPQEPAKPAGGRLGMPVRVASTQALSPPGAAPWEASPAPIAPSLTPPPPGAPAGPPPGGPWLEGPGGPPLEGDLTCDPGVGPPYGAHEPRHWFWNHMKLRHSSTHGRAMGPGTALRGTSWLNRPYAVGYDFGAFLMTDGPADSVRAANDTFNALHAGLDFDHYWGAQLRIGVTAPRLLQTQQIGVGDPEENLFVLDWSFVYYPWGDSRMRPYYRVGVGLTDIDYVNVRGVRINEKLLTIPFGVGVKYQLKKHVALRGELIDNFAIGMNETDSLHNLTLTLGCEWRWGNGTKHLGGWTGHHHTW